MFSAVTAYFTSRACEAEHRHATNIEAGLVGMMLLLDASLSITGLYYIFAY